MNRNIFKKTFQSALFEYEEPCWINRNILIGIDEAGRGSLFGPVVVSAVILKNNSYNELIKDSKKLSEKQREEAYKWIKKNSINITIIASHNEIDKYNIYQATKISMYRSIEYLVCKIKKIPDQILTDAMPLQLDKDFFYKTEVISKPKGESWSATIAAASIVAKVERDKIIKNFSKIMPNYNLEKHKGYATKDHKEKMVSYGYSFIHRKTFNIKEIK